MSQKKKNFTFDFFDFLSRSNDRLLGSEVAGVLLMLMTVQTV